MSDNKLYKKAWVKHGDLSRGGQGETITATRIGDSDELFVVKILHSQNDDERRARMHRESAALLSFDHPNLPKVIDTNTEYFKDKEYKLYLVTSFIPGPTGSDFNFSELSLEQVIEFTEEVLGVLNYCHERGILHRDIKPDNIIFRNGEYNDPVLIDFGISFNKETLEGNLTPDGQHLGNRFLIMPEQKVGEAGKRSDITDITSVIGLFFYALTRIIPTIISDEFSNKPHQREEAKAVIDRYPKHQKDIINYIFDVGFNQIIDKRWQSIQSVIEQLALLKNSKEEANMSRDEIIAKIKQTTGQQKYQDAKFLSDLYSEVDTKVRQALTEVTAILGPEWTSIQSGGYQRESYRNRLAPHNAVLGLSMETIIYAFINGSELVIQVIEPDSTKEVFREPVSNDHNWGQFIDKMKDHYLAEIAKHV